ncbi:MAG: TlpA family protein disulfide reductase, partial [Gammaproteobacteria bacterium]
GLYFWGATLIGTTPNATPDMNQTFNAPTYTLKRLDGGTVPASALRGKTVVLAFWATWCEPCREELPQLANLYNKHWRSNPRIKFYAVDVGLGGDTPAKAKAFLEKLGINLPAAFDKGGDLSRKLRTGGVLPVRVVIAPDGVVRFRKAGYATSDAGFSTLQKAVAAATRSHQ